MLSGKINENIHWVGAIDWDIRNFHGYLTQRGTTYNSYLIMDDKIVLIDTVKHYLSEEMLGRIKSVVDPRKIDYIVSNHVEMDHSGSIKKLLEFAPNAKVVTSVQGEKGLRRHFKCDWNFHVVNSGDTLKTGKYSLQFVHVPMVHWPDSMVCYLPGEEILFSNDAFGQHIASNQRYDDELGWDIISEESAKYYGNIVLPYGAQVKKALDVLSKLDIRMICPSHGIIWRSFISRILKKYIQWSGNLTENHSVIIYDTMWGSTEMIARVLSEGLCEAGIASRMLNLKTNHISDIITALIEAKLILIGSPTLNNGVLPSVGSFLTYMKGLKPKDRVGMSFGSFGWSGEAVNEIETVMRELNWELPQENINIRYIPDSAELDTARLAGRKLAEYVVKT